MFLWIVAGTAVLGGVFFIMVILLGLIAVATDDQNRRATSITSSSSESSVVGVITSANAGGMCLKNINGQRISLPQVAFSYSVGGTSYNSVGCVYDASLVAGSRVNICYNASQPAGAKICGK